MSFLTDPLFLRVAFAGCGVALAAGPLGAFVVWRRMAYFSDATAHAAILGAALALMLEVSVLLGALMTALVMAVAAGGLAGRGRAVDTVLGVVSYSALAVGLVVVSLNTGARIDVAALLFGDILIVRAKEVWTIWGGALLIVTLLAWRWSRLLTATLSPELARASGINPRHEQLILTLALAVVVAVAIKVVGALLIGALLVIPAAAARPLARTPEAMVLWTIVLAMVSVLAGLVAAWQWNLLAGAAIVCMAAVIFLASLGVRPRSV